MAPAQARAGQGQERFNQGPRLVDFHPAHAQHTVTKEDTHKVTLWERSKPSLPVLIYYTTKRRQMVLAPDDFLKAFIRTSGKVMYGS
jgi:hypothetical protein